MFQRKARWRISSGGIDAAGAWIAIARHAAGVATIEDGGETGVVGQLAVEGDKLIVDDGVFGAPIEIVRHQALIHAVDFFFGPIGRNLRAVS